MSSLASPSSSTITASRFDVVSIARAGLVQHLAMQSLAVGGSPGVGNRVAVGVDHRAGNPPVAVVDREVGLLAVGAPGQVQEAVGVLLTLSNTTTESYSEKPRMVRMPMTVAGVTSNPTIEYTPAVTVTSKTSEASAAMRHVQLEADGDVHRDQHEEHRERDAAPCW